MDIEVFSRPGSSHCAEAEHFLASLVSERPELRVVVRDVVADPAALARLRALASARGQTALSVPTFLVGDELVVGFAGADTTGREIRRLLEQTTPSDTDGVEVPLLGRVTARDWQHYAYLGLYNAFYMLDDAIVLTTAVVTLERYKLSERGGRTRGSAGGGGGRAPRSPGHARRSSGRRPRARPPWQR